MLRHALARLLVLALLVSGLIAPPAPAGAAVGEAEYQAAAHLLGQYGLVQGDERGYRFHDPITRAEVAKLLVYSLGLGSQAGQFTGRGDFTDTAGHWAEGIIALARAYGLMRGYPEGDFRPQNPVTYAEVVTALSRLVGLEPGPAQWPRTYLRPAQEAGIIPPDMLLEYRLEEPALRGDVFVLLKRTLADVKNYQGETLLRRYLDPDPPELVLDPHPEQTSAASLFLSGMVREAAELRINGEPVPFEAYGYFRHEVPLQVGPNTIRVHALDEAGNLAEEVVEVTRVPGQPNAISLTGPDRVTVGQAAQFRLTVFDANGVELSDRTGVTAEVTPPLGTFEVETGRFIAGTTAGQATLTVRAGSSRSSVTITVAPGPLERLAVEPPEVTLNPGQTATFTARGYDAFGNEVPLPDVTWSADGGTIQPTGLFQAPSAVGTYRVTAAVGGKKTTAMVYPPNHEATSVRLTRAADRTLRANGQSEVMLTATVVDAAGRTVTDYKGSLFVASSDPAVASPVERMVPVVDGEAHIRVRAGTRPGSVRITAETNLGRTGSLTLTVQPQRLQSIQLSGFALPSRDGTPQGMVEAVALDQDGYPMRSPLVQTVLVTLQLTPSGAGQFVSNGQETADIALGPVDPETGTVRTRTAVTYDAGSGTLTITGEPKLESQNWVQVLPGAIRADQVGLPAKLSIEPVVDTRAGEPRSIYVNVLDADGYRVTQPGPLTGVVVTLEDQTGTVWWPTVTAQAGQGRVQFDVTQTRAGIYTYTARLQPGGATARITARVVPADPAEVALQAIPAELPADERSQTTLRATLTDAYGNRVTAPAYRYTFERVGPRSGVTEGFSTETVTTAGGVAEVTVTAGTVIGTEQFRVTVSNPANPSAPMPGPATTSVTTFGSPVRLAIRYGDNDRNGQEGEATDNTGQAGRPFTVRVEVHDPFGNRVSHDRRTVTLTVHSLTDDGQRDRTYRATTEDGVVVFTLPATLKAGTYALKAEAEGLMKALTEGYGGSVADAVLTPGHPTGMRLVADVYTLNADGGTSYALVTVQLIDQLGNVTTNQTGAVITVTLTTNQQDDRYGYFTVDDEPSGIRTQSITVWIQRDAMQSNSVRFYSGEGSGTVRIAATSLDGETAGPLTLTMTALGEMAGLTYESQPDVTEDAGGAPVNGDLLVLTAVDGAGRRMTHYTGTIGVESPDGAVTIAAYFDPASGQWVEGAPSGGLLATDRGQAMVLLEAASGTQALTIWGDPQSSGARVEEQTIFLNF